MLDPETGESVEKTLKHEGEGVREFYSALPHPVLVGIEATGSMYWFLELLEELGIEHQVGHPTEIRAAEPRKQKHDRRDAALLLKLQVEKRFPSIWMPSAELRDLRALLRHRHQWVRMRTRVQNTLQAIALSHGLRRGQSLWSRAGQQAIAQLPLAPHAAQRRTELQTLYGKLGKQIDELSEQVMDQASQRPGAKLIDDPSRSRACHGLGDGRVFRRPGAVRRWQSGGELCGYDPERIFQRRAAAAGWVEQARQSATPFSLV
jgi:transposase